MPQGRGSTAARASFANGRNLREVGLHQCPLERNGKGVPVGSLRVPSHVPSHPQTAAKVRGFSLTASGFTAETDWPLEGSGFELVWGFSCQVVVLGLLQFFVRSGKGRSSFFNRAPGVKKVMHSGLRRIVSARRGASLANAVSFLG